jgi:hypothetical protein
VSGRNDVPYPSRARVSHLLGQLLAVPSLDAWPGVSAVRAVRAVSRRSHLFPTTAIGHPSHVRIV